MGKTDCTSSFSTSNRLVNFPLTSSRPSLPCGWALPCAERYGMWLRMVQLHKARMPSTSETSLLSPLTDSSQVNSSWLKYSNEDALRVMVVSEKKNSRAHLRFGTGTEKFRTMVAEAEMCLPLTSKLRFQPLLDECVDTTRNPFLTFTLDTAENKEKNEFRFRDNREVVGMTLFPLTSHGPWHVKYHTGTNVYLQIFLLSIKLFMQWETTTCIWKKENIERKKVKDQKSPSHQKDISEQDAFTKPRKERHQVKQGKWNRMLQENMVLTFSTSALFNLEEE